jgi:hypothetical protein
MFTETKFALKKTWLLVDFCFMLEQAIAFKERR